MMLSKNTINKSIVIDNKTIELSKSVKILGLTIDTKLNFGRIRKFLGRIRNRLNLLQAKILCNSFILS